MNQITPTTELPPAVPGIRLRPDMPIGLAVMFDEEIRDRIIWYAETMSKSGTMCPTHLAGKPHACFAVITRALTWNLDPYAVANCTFQTPGGSVGVEGKLVQAIIEQTGKLEDTLHFDHFGEWDEQVGGKFEIKKGKTGKDYAARTWTLQDAKGLGVVISGHLKGELEPRKHTLYLDRCFPYNSTLWATDPAQQICYRGARAWANVCAPSLLMGIPFADEVGSEQGMRDITPPVSMPPSMTPAHAEILVGDPPGTIGSGSTGTGKSQSYMDGWNARMQQVRFRDAPDLSPSDYDDWCKGWQDADKEAHGDAGEPAGEDVTTEDTSGPVADISDQPPEDPPQDPRAVAFEHGERAFRNGQSLQGNPHGFEKGPLLEAYKDGWRAAEKQEKESK